MTVVYTVGTLDLLHIGHIALLEFCSTLGDIVAVGVASDSVVSLYKLNVPVIPFDQRAEMLKALRYEDIVRPYHKLKYVSACKKLDVDMFVIGEDWGNKPHNIAFESYLSTRIKENVVSQSFSSRRMDNAAV